VAFAKLTFDLLPTLVVTHVLGSGFTNGEAAGPFAAVREPVAIVG